MDHDEETDIVEDVEENMDQDEDDEEGHEEEEVEAGEVDEGEDEGDASEDELDDELDVEGETDLQVYRAAWTAPKNLTTPMMTKYEIARVLGLRTDELCKGAPPTVPASDFPGGVYPKNPEEIAKMELRKNRSPFIIKRPLPSGLYVTIPVSQLIIPGYVLN